MALPLQDRSHYRMVRNRLEALMAARKVTRDYDPSTWGSTAPKSSLDGLRESVIPESLYPVRGDSLPERERKANHLYTAFNAGPAERLSGVDLLKRRGNRGDDAHFPSTSHMPPSLLDHLVKEKEAATAPWTAYVKVLKTLDASLETVPHRYSRSLTGDYDGSLLFEERLAESLEGAKLSTAQKALRTFLQATGDARPQPYYALLLADGDGMDKAIDALGARGRGLGKRARMGYT